MRWASVQDMDCTSCTAKIATAVRRIPGVSGVKISFATNTLTVGADPALVSARRIERADSHLGFRPTEVATICSERRLSPGRTRLVPCFQGFFCSPQVSASNSAIRAAIMRLPGLSPAASRQ